MKYSDLSKKFKSYEARFQFKYTGSPNIYAGASYTITPKANSYWTFSPTKLSGTSTNIWITIPEQQLHQYTVTQSITCTQIDTGLQLLATDVVIGGKSFNGGLQEGINVINLNSITVG